MKKLENIVPKIILGLYLLSSAYLTESCIAAPAVVQFSSAIATACAVKYGGGNRDFEQCLLRNNHPAYGK
ncbi:hypothetical protein HY449_04775 [Candidatus Pacearchaeota archaeon]|nr:hypothetical protein [Candidatus Pacearchaeota archaeon]